MEDLIDRLFTGCRLTTDVLNMPGSTGTQPTHYLIIQHIFTKMVSISNTDAIMDVGCGQGRVLGYLQRRYPGVGLSGIDFNEASIAVARRWAEKKNVTLYCQDALTMDYNPYTILYLFRPFPPSAFSCFINHLEETMIHPIRMIYMSDQESSSYIQGRNGWKLIHREAIFKLHHLQVAASPQGCSVWNYTPAEF